MIDIDQLRKLSPQDGDVFIVPVGTDYQDARELAEALHLAKPGVKCVVIQGDIKRLSTADMNAAGWYRA
ncbi:hypothetical protein D9M71_263750 [compost metagenome]